MEAQFITMVREALTPECCLICGKNHDIRCCDYVKIEKHVPDTPIPSRARLTLPSFLEVQMLSDGAYFIITKNPISKGTKFGPFQAEKSENLEPKVSFPLKVFESNGNKSCEYYLDTNNEERCSWLMFVGAAEFAEEQNLICYQEKEHIYYVAIKNIPEGGVLKVWYSPHYALKMNKTLLPPKPIEVPLIDVNSLIKKQQKIMERKVWTCKFCSHMEHNIVSFARHILKHYTAQHKNMCEICKKTFGSKRNLKNHMKIVHQVFLSTSPPKLAKATVTVQPRCKDVALGGPLLNDMFTDSSDLNQLDLNLDNQNLLLDNDNLTVENLLNDNVKDLDHFNFEIDDSQKQFVCDICLKQFTKAKLLIIHLRHHTGDFVCYKCLKVFCRKENLKSHVCNISNQFRCSMCDKVFTQKKYLSRHLQAIHNKKFHCVSCNKSYHSNKELSEHNCSKVPDMEKEKFVCPICSKHFYRDIYLKRHLRTHGPRSKSSKRSTTCEVCGLHLTSKTSYFSHRKIHEEPTFSCEICDKKFKRADILKEHIACHQEPHQFECHVCRKTLKSKKILSTHLKQHNSLYSIKCPICEVVFKRRNSLNTHMRNYHERKKSTTFEFYTCPVCNKSIKLKSSLHRHLKRVHSDLNKIDLSSITPKITRNKKKESLQTEVDDQISSLLTSAENNAAIEKHAVDSLVEELDIERKKSEKEVCLSIPELTENYQEITLDKNAYILDNGTIVQPQEDSDNVIIYVLDQTY